MNFLILTAYLLLYDSHGSENWVKNSVNEQINKVHSDEALVWIGGLERFDRFPDAQGWIGKDNQIYSFVFYDKANHESKYKVINPVMQEEAVKSN